MTPRILGLTALALSAFAANSLLCRAALEAGAVDPLTFTTVRLASGAVMLGALAGRGSGGARGWRPWGPALALFAYALAFSLAYVRIPAAVGALALFGAVQVTMVGLGLLYGERPGRREWIGSGLALAGLVALALPGLAAPDPAGVGLMAGAGAAWGVYSLLGRRAGAPLAANAASFARCVPLALVAQAAGVWAVPVRATGTGLVLALASGALASGLGYAVWYAALRGLSAHRAALVQLAVPPLAAAGAVAFLGEALTLPLVACGGAVLGGIALAMGGRGRGGGPRARP